MILGRLLYEDLTSVYLLSPCKVLFKRLHSGQVTLTVGLLVVPT